MNLCLPLKRKLRQAHNPNLVLMYRSLDDCLLKKKGGGRACSPSFNAPLRLITALLALFPLQRTTHLTPFLLRLPQQAIYHGGCCLVHVGEDVSVDTQGDGYIGMPLHLAHQFDVDSVTEQQGGNRVPQVMKTDRS
jgi:hypothetical protein